MADNTNMTNFLAGLEGGKPLLASFRKFFDGDSPSNILYSIDFGKSLFSFFAPKGTKVPSDPSTLMLATRSFFAAGLADNEITDETFVRFLIRKFKSEPDLITPDMLYELMKSDAYQKFGTVGDNRREDKKLKYSFEIWLRDKSTLSLRELNKMSLAGATYYQDELTNVINLFPLAAKDKDERIKLIKDKKATFRKEFVDKENSEAILKKLQENAGNDKLEYSEQIKNAYGILCGDKDKAKQYCDYIDYLKAGTKSKNRNKILTDAGVEVNTTLAVVAKLNGWNDEQLSSIWVRSDFEKRAEKFEEEAKNRTDGILGKASKKNRFNPFADIAKTSLVTLGGSTVFSAISTLLPGSGAIIATVLGGAALIRAGMDCIAYSKKGLAKKDIAVKTAASVLTKSAPLILSMTMGPWTRAIGSVTIGIKSVFADMERRAKEQNDELQRTKPHGFKEYLKRLSEIGHTIGVKGVAKSIAYGVTKGAAVGLAGWGGSKGGKLIGDKLHTFADANFTNGKLLDELKERIHHKQIDTASDDEKVEIETQSTEDNLVVKVNETNSSSQSTTQSNTQSNTQSQTNNEFEKSFQTNNNHVGSHLSNENMQKLGKIGDVELTKNARATVHAGAHRQYINGVQKDWYSSSQEQAAIDSLHRAGVDDATGVLRKLGSASRLIGGDYQETLNNLCAGNDVTDNDVKQIFGALDKIDAEGGLIKNTTIPTPSGAEKYRVSDTNFDLGNENIDKSTTLTSLDYSNDDTSSIQPPLSAQKYRVSDDDTLFKTNSEFVDNSVVLDAPDYEPEKLKTLKVPFGAESYRAAEDNNSFDMESNSTEQIIPVPDSARNYVHSDLNLNDSFETNDAAEPFSGYQNEIPFSNQQLTNLRVGYLRSAGLDSAEAGRYLSEFNQSEIVDICNHLSVDEISELENALKTPQPSSRDFGSFIC